MGDYHGDLGEVAEQIAVAAGAIAICPDCETDYVSKGDDDANKRAFAIASNRLKAGKIKADTKALMDAIQSVVENTPEDCPECIRREHRDD